MSSSGWAPDLGAAILVGLFLASCGGDTGARRVPSWGRPPSQATFDRELGLPSAIVDSKTGIELVLVRPGSFLMGHVLGEDAWEDSLPVHRVEITKPFYLGRYEVSQREYSILCGGPGIGDPRMPACAMNWHEAHRAAQNGGFRLPTEAEWEYACRAGSMSRFYGKLDEIAWYESNSEGDTADGRVPILQRVGQKKPNSWGLFDMIGNVDEWCADSWKEDAYVGLDDKVTRDPFLESARNQVDLRVVRGGSYRLAPVFLGAGKRAYAMASLQDPETGFRVARDP